MQETEILLKEHHELKATAKVGSADSWALLVLVRGVSGRHTTFWWICGVAMHMARPSFVSFSSEEVHVVHIL